MRRSLDRASDHRRRGAVTVGSRRTGRVRSGGVRNVMIITKKALPRRTFLRGMGATLALPLLDAMVPALSAATSAAAAPVRRMGVVYVPNGVNLAKWAPTGGGSDLRVLADAQPAGAVPRSDHDPAGAGLRSRRVVGLRHRRSRTAAAVLPERNASQESRSPGPRRHDHRSDRRAGGRPADAAEVARDVDRANRSERVVLGLGVRLHLYADAVVAESDLAGADGQQSANGLRADVRRGQQRRRAAREHAARRAASSTRSRRRSRGCRS